MSNSLLKHFCDPAKTYPRDETKMLQKKEYNAIGHCGLSMFFQ